MLNKKTCIGCKYVCIYSTEFFFRLYVLKRCSNRIAVKKKEKICKYGVSRRLNFKFSVSMEIERILL